VSEYNVHLIRPVDAGPILTLNELEQERWAKASEQFLVMPIETQHAADQLAELISDAEQTLEDMQTYIRDHQRQHLLESHS